MQPTRKLAADLPHSATTNKEEAMTTESQQPQPSNPLFLYIPSARLILSSIASMGLYEAYWISKNWRYIKEREGLKISPFWRGVFGIFFCHSLLRKIHADEEARSVQVPAFSAGGLATSWVILMIVANIVGRAPSIAASIISAFIPSFLCLVPVQNYINTVIEKRSPGTKFYRWSSGHIVCLVIGIIIWALLLIGLGSEM
jgi:amino acid permease